MARLVELQITVRSFFVNLSRHTSKWCNLFIPVNVNKFVCDFSGTSETKAGGRCVWLHLPGLVLMQTRSCEPDWTAVGAWKLNKSWFYNWNKVKLIRQRCCSWLDECGSGMLGRACDRSLCDKHWLNSCSCERLKRCDKNDTENGFN